MKELRVHAITLEEQNDVINKLRDILLTDPYFYFLHEAGFVVIRTNEKEMADLLKYFTLHVNLPADKYSYDVKEYEEWNSTVKENNETFTKIMHEACVIALNGKVRYELFERITHCMFNIFDEGLRKETKASYNLEAKILANLALDRSFTEGLYFGKTQVSDEQMKSYGF
jgi:hypothetical protein